MLCVMSDSSSSDDEVAKFKEACDPTLWRTTTAQEVSKDGTRVEAWSDQCQADLRQSFLLLEKIRASLTNGQGKIGNLKPDSDSDKAQHHHHKPLLVNEKRLSQDIVLLCLVSECSSILPWQKSQIIPPLGYLFGVFSVCAPSCPAKVFISSFHKTLCLVLFYSTLPPSAKTLTPHLHLL